MVTHTFVSETGEAVSMTFILERRPQEPATADLVRYRAHTSGGAVTEATWTRSEAEHLMAGLMEVLS